MTFKEFMHIEKRWEMLYIHDENNARVFMGNNLYGRVFEDYLDSYGDTEIVKYSFDGKLLELTFKEAGSNG